MPKLRGDVKILSPFYVLLLSQIWWDVYWVSEFVGSWVWIFLYNLCLKHFSL